MSQKYALLVSGLSLIALASTGCDAITGKLKGSDSKAATAAPEAAASAAPTAGGSAAAKAGDFGKPGTATAPGSYVEVAGQADNNNDRDKAFDVTYVPEFSLFLPDEDADWLKLTTPDDGKPHLVELSYEQPSGSRFQGKVYSAADNSELGAFYPDAGTKKSVFFTLGPKVTVHFEFTKYGESDGLHKFKLKVTPENEQYVNHGERSTAAPVALNTDIKGQLWSAYSSSDSRSSDDWYKADLAAGEVTIKFVSVPENLRLSLSILDKNFSAVDTAYMDGPGTVSESKFTIQTAGTHYFQLSDYGSENVNGIIESVKPKGLFEQYTLRIEQ